MHQQVDPARLYAVNGLQFLPFNTLYQLAAEPDLQHAARALLIPDLLGYWLTGRRGRRGDQRLHHRPARRPHRRLGAGAGRGAGPARRAAARRRRGRAGPRPVSAEVARRARDRPASCCVTTVGSHDTASAVVGVPADRPALRLHLLRHLGPGRRRAGRAGADRGQPAGELHQRARRRRHHPLPAQRHGAVAAVGVDPLRGTCAAHDVDLHDVLDAAAGLPPRARGSTRTTRRSCRPGDMPARIAEACRDAGRAGAAEPGRRSSGASSTASPPRSPSRSSRPSGCPGSRSRSCTSSAAARRTRCSASSPPTPAGARWSPGPVEATALGNLLVQARTHGVLSRRPAGPARADPRHRGADPLRAAHRLTGSASLANLCRLARRAGRLAGRRWIERNGGCPGPGLSGSWS